MKLTTPSGELTLPSDFSFEIEQNSAFFSEEGAASVAATIPATPADKAKLGFPSRLGRKSRFVNIIPATLQQGIYQKTGQLIVSGATDKSITCSIALEDSSFYSQHKDKKLKELFASKVDTRYSTPANWYSWLWKVYKGEVSSDFRLFPVAVNYSEEGYQMNNEPVYSSATSDEIWPLAHEPRIIMEGGEQVSVPEGYGIAPFLKLPVFIKYIFELCGYTVGSSCFSEDPFLSQLVLVHNCSDVICNGRIDYSDLVPNCTISDILEWIQNKFHAQIVVEPSSSTVNIVLLETILQKRFDLNLTGKVLGGLSHKFESTSRVVMTPDTSLDGAAPAAETIEALKAKYGYVMECDEKEFGALNSSCLALRLATGDYYEIRQSFGSSYSRGSNTAIKKVKVGTNQFKYDRGNSEDSEEFSPSDLVPPIVSVDQYGTLAPYIGDRVHRNTSYNDSEKDTDQEIIVVYYAGLTEKPTYDTTGGRVPLASAGYYYAGTTQKYNNRGHLIDGAIELTPEGLVHKYFSLYNKHLRNNAITVSGEFKLTIEELLHYDLYSLKLLDGQLMLPVGLRYEVGRQLRCLQAEFKLIKDYSDDATDNPVVIPEPIYKWTVNQTEITAKATSLASEYTGTIRWKYDSSDEYISGDKDLFIPAPKAAGEKTPPIVRQVLFIQRIQGPRDYTERNIGVFALNEWFESVPIS